MCVCLCVCVCARESQDGSDSDDDGLGEAGRGGMHTMDVDADGDEDDGGINVQDIDAYWLQREVAKAFGDAVKKDERLSQKLAEEVLSTLEVRVLQLLFNAVASHSGRVGER
jgi:hypothetical protein